MLITFEGIDGSGKSTQAIRLAEALEKSGRAVLLVREPGGTALGESIRDLLLDPAGEVAAMAELLLFSAARAQLVEEVIRPALAEGACVIADRFYDSTTAYQGSGRGLQDADWLEAFHARVTGGLEPARTFVMDVPIDVAFRRRTSRDDDRIEAGGANFFERVRTGYLALAARNPARVRVLDATRTPDELHREILAIVLAL